MKRLTKLVATASAFGILILATGCAESPTAPELDTSRIEASYGKKTNTDVTPDDGGEPIMGTQGVVVGAQG